MRKMRTVLVVAAVAVVLAACGTTAGPEQVATGKAGGARAAAFVQHAAATTSETSTGRFTATASIGTGTTPVTVDGAFDKARKAAIVHVGGKGSSKLQGMSTLTVDGVVYLDLGAAGGANGLGGMIGLKTRWVSLDVQKLAKDHGFKLPTASPGATGGDPQSVLDLLKGVSGSVTQVGTDTVRGTTTTHYKASIVPAKALAKLPADRQAKIRKALGDEALDTPIPVDVWIGADGLVRKATLTEDLPHVGTVSTSVEIYDLGQPVSIPVPPKSQVTPAEQIPMLKSLLGG